MEQGRTDERQTSVGTMSPSDAHGIRDLRFEISNHAKRGGSWSVGSFGWRSRRERTPLAEQPGPAQDSAEVVLHLLERSVHDGRPSHQDHQKRRGQRFLLKPERLAQQASRPAANHRGTNPAGSDDPQAGTAARRGRHPVDDHTASRGTTAHLPQTRELTAATQTHRPGETQPARGRAHGTWVQTGVRRLRPSRRRLARIARPLLLLLRARNPCWRFRRIFDG